MFLVARTHEQLSPSLLLRLILTILMQILHGKRSGYHNNKNSICVRKYPLSFTAYFGQPQTFVHILNLHKIEENSIIFLPMDEQTNGNVSTCFNCIFRRFLLQDGWRFWDTNVKLKLRVTDRLLLLF